MILRRSLWESLGDMHDQVCSYLSQADLFSLSLVSKTSRADVEPLLFASVELKWDRKRKPLLVSFLNVILKRPELASYVKSVVFQGDYLGDAHTLARPDRWIPHVPTRISSDRLEFDAASQAIRRSGVPYHNEWTRELQGGRLDAFIALILAQMPALENLVLGPCESSPPGFLGMLFTSALCKSGKYRLPKYDQLRSLTYIVREYAQNTAKHREKNTPDALPFFYLPAVQSLALGLDNPRTLEWPTQRPALCNLTSLHLTCVRETHLQNLLSSTSRLKKLHWDYFYIYFDDWEPPIYKPDTDIPLVVIRLDILRQALLQIENTLEDLNLAYSIHPGDSLDDPDAEVRGTLMEVNDFPQLKILTVPMPFLALWSPGSGKLLADHISSGVQEVIITNDLLANHDDYEWWEDEFFNAVELWLRSCETTHPMLKSVTLRLENSATEWPSARREEFEDMCRCRGVEGNVVRLLAPWELGKKYTVT